MQDAILLLQQRNMFEELEPGQSSSTKDGKIIKPAHHKSQAIDRTPSYRSAREDAWEDREEHDPKQGLYRALGVGQDEEAQQQPVLCSMQPSSPMNRMYRFFGMYSDRISPRYFTSPLMAPSTLGKCRFAIGIYALGVVLIDAIHTRFFADLSLWVTYFTHITFVALSAYFLFGGWHTLTYAQHGMTRGLPTWSRPLQLMHMVLQHTVCAFAFLVTIVYWAVLAGDMSLDPYSLWINVSMHALNTAFVLFEIWCSRVTTRFALMIPSFALVLLYLPVVYISYARTHQWVYFFFGSANSAIVAGSILGIGGLSLLCNTVVQLLQALRERVFTAKRGMSDEEAQEQGFRAAPQVSVHALELQQIAP
jgi:hypothetical protein